MTWLAENVLAIWMCGAVALAFAIFVYTQTRTSGALYGVLGVLAVTAALLCLSYFLDTPRKSIERTLYALAATVEANDVRGTLAFLAPDADPQLRKDAETLMPQVNIERARILGTPQIDLGAGSPPASATVECRGIILATNRQNGMKGGGDDHLLLFWTRRDDHWLLKSYTSQKNWNRALAH